MCALCCNVVYYVVCGSSVDTTCYVVNQIMYILAYFVSGFCLIGHNQADITCTFPPICCNTNVMMAC
jgi:hypothetical protein